VQGDDAWDAGEQSVTGTAKDKTFPFYKPLVVSDSVEGTDVGRRAEHELKKRTAAGYGIRLVVKGHSQGGVNYRANRLARVVDDALGISGRFMVLGRDFTYSEKDGPMTEIRLGLPMEGYEVS
jgi:prophage tail gpP-like protein